MTDTGLELRSLIKETGELELSFKRVPVPVPAADQIVVRVEASPINPSDLGLLLGTADLSTAKASGVGEASVLTCKISEAMMRPMRGRVGQSLPVGNEGAGTVVAAGANAKALEGKKVAMLGGAMYAQYRLVRTADALVLPPDASAADGASCFVNPLTALGMVEA